jgi:hypothetical protein
MGAGDQGQRFDRRRFLLGAGGAILALPMLETFAPRTAGAAPPKAPKRLVVVRNSHGRTVGTGLTKNGKLQDNWSPRTTTGPYPATGQLSPLLAALGKHRNEIVTVDGVDNLVRHMTGDVDGHFSACLTAMNCTKPTLPLSTPSGPSIDYVAGERLRSSAAQRAALLFVASTFPTQDPWRYGESIFSGADGTAPAVVDPNPVTAIQELFGQKETEGPPPAKTLADRLASRRTSILDSVAKSYTQLSRDVTAADRERLEQHASFLRSLEMRFAGDGPIVLAKGCARPDEAEIPPFDPAENLRGDLDGMVTPWIIENLVMSLACDITRVASLDFQLDYDPTFSFEFDGPSPLGGSNNYHGILHDNGLLGSPQEPALTKAFQHMGKMFARLLDRLAAIEDTDGSRLLDNTLVLWTSELGYGTHASFNHPVLLAGMKSAFEHGQGRHVVMSDRRSLGDLYAKVLRMLGGTDTTFGTTGKIGDSGLSGDEALVASLGYPGFIKASTPLHLGDLPL